MMEKKTRNLLAAGIFILMLAAGLFLFRPILLPFFWALIVAVGLNPLTRLLVKGLKSRTLASLIVCLLVLAFLLVPAWQFTRILGQQSVRFVAKMEHLKTPGEALPPGLTRIVAETEAWVNARTSALGVKFDGLEIFRKSLVSASKALADLPRLVAGFSLFLVDLFFFFVILFFLLRFGRELAGYFRELLPVDPERTNVFFSKFREMAVVSLLSSLVIALAQGTLGFVIYLCLGVEEPLLWAVLTGLCSFVPIIGASAAWVSVTVLFLVSGAWVKAILMLCLGAGVISVADNIIRPLLIRGKSNIHPVLLFFSIICGIRTMGFIGIFAGPLITVIVLAAIDIYHASLKTPAPPSGPPVSPGKG